MPKITEAHIGEVSDSLCEKILSQKKEDTEQRDISSIGLKTLIGYVSSERAADTVLKHVTPKLLDAMHLEVCSLATNLSIFVVFYVSKLACCELSIEPLPQVSLHNLVTYLLFWWCPTLIMPKQCPKDLSESIFGTNSRSVMPCDWVVVSVCITSLVHPNSLQSVLETC